MQHPLEVASTRGESVKAAATSSLCDSISDAGSPGRRMIPGQRRHGERRCEARRDAPPPPRTRSVTRALRPSPATSASARPQRPGSLLRRACSAKSGTDRTAYLIRRAPRGWARGCAPCGLQAGRPPPRASPPRRPARGGNPARASTGRRAPAGRRSARGPRPRRPPRSAAGGASGTRASSERALRAAAQVEDDGGVVAVADKDVRDREGLRRVAAAHPDEVAQHVARQRPRRKAVGPVDQRDPLARGLGGGEQPRDDGLPPAAGDGRDEPPSAWPAGRPPPSAPSSDGTAAATPPDGLRVLSGKRAERSDRRAETVWDWESTRPHSFQYAAGAPLRDQAHHDAPGIPGAAPGRCRGSACSRPAAQLGRARARGA